MVVFVFVYLLQIIDIKRDRCYRKNTTLTERVLNPAASWIKCMLMCFKFQYRMVDIKITVVGKASTADICLLQYEKRCSWINNNIDQHNITPIGLFATYLRTKRGRDTVCRRQNSTEKSHRLSKYLKVPRSNILPQFC